METPKSYAEVAKDGDLLVTTAMKSLREVHPTHGGAVLAGALGAVVRYQMAALPVKATPAQVLQAMAPTIHMIANQVVTAKAKADGRTVPLITEADPVQSAYTALTRALGLAFVQTFAIWAQGRLYLVSIEPAGDQVRTFASEPDLDAVLGDPELVIHNHCAEAQAAWSDARLGLQ